MAARYLTHITHMLIYSVPTFIRWMIKAFSGVNPHIYMFSEEISVEVEIDGKVMTKNGYAMVEKHYIMQE